MQGGACARRSAFCSALMSFPLHWNGAYRRDIAIYERIGMNMIAVVDNAYADVQLTRDAAHNGERVNGEYPGYDRFGRLQRQMWVDGGFTTNPNSTNVPNVPAIFEEQYTYDDDSNRTAAYDDRPGGRQPFSHEYTCDGLDRLTEGKRGV